jgi:ADP-ribose pyrophosphatase YjhB (NUDIX family)
VSRVRFCPACGSALREAPPTECTACGYALFVNAKPTGSAIIRDGNDVLIVRRARDPQAGEWDFPGGFCDGWELPADAAVREAREELGVEIELTRFVGMYLSSYLYQDEKLPVLDCFWLARIVSGRMVLDPSELLDYRWVPLGEVPPLAFASMDAALVEATRSIGSV